MKLSLKSNFLAVKQFPIYSASHKIIFSFSQKLNDSNSSCNYSYTLTVKTNHERRNNLSGNATLSRTVVQ
jgi:hypothetical protein